MRYCNRCVMPDTRPGIRFDENGICFPCLNAERRKSIDWDKRLDELKALCDKYRGSNGDYYDCVIAVSGGKDSHYQVYMMKEVMNMNPLLFSVDNFSWTQTGRDNFFNIRDAFRCDCISLNLSPDTARRLYRKRGDGTTRKERRTLSGKKKRRTITATFRSPTFHCSVSLRKKFRAFAKVFQSFLRHEDRDSWKNTAFL